MKIKKLKYPVIVDEFCEGGGRVRPNWCSENIGKGGEDWDHSPEGYAGELGKIVYAFKREKDAVFFALRWA